MTHRYGERVSSPSPQHQTPRLPYSVRNSRLVICGMSDSLPGNVQMNDDGIVKKNQGRRGRTVEWSHLAPGEDGLHVRRRGAHTRTHKRHVCPPQSPSGVALVCSEKVRTPHLPSPTDNEISPPCVSLCPSSRDSPPSHTKPFAAVRAQEG